MNFWARKLWNDAKEIFKERVKLKDLYEDVKQAPKEIKYLASNLKRRVRKAISKLKPPHQNSYKELEEFSKEIQKGVEIVLLVQKKFDNDGTYRDRAACGRLIDALYFNHSNVKANYEIYRINKNSNMQKTI